MMEDELRSNDDVAEYGFLLTSPEAFQLWHHVHHELFHRRETLKANLCT